MADAANAGQLAISSKPTDDRSFDDAFALILIAGLLL
jgi:hypothetical protein